MTVAKKFTTLSFWSNIVGSGCLTSSLFTSRSLRIFSTYWLNRFTFYRSLFLVYWFESVRKSGWGNTDLSYWWNRLNCTSSCFCFNCYLISTLSDTLRAAANSWAISSKISSYEVLLDLLKLLFYFSLNLKANKWLYSSWLGLQRGLYKGNFSSYLLLLQ